MRLKLPKCKFGFAEVDYLGHIVGRFGLKMQPNRISAIEAVKIPLTKTEEVFLAWQATIGLSLGTLLELVFLG